MKITITLEDGEANSTSTNGFLSVDQAKDWAKDVIESFVRQTDNQIGFLIEQIPPPGVNTSPKITGIKLIRQYMEIGLKEAKDLIESDNRFVKPVKPELLYNAAKDFEYLGFKIKLQNREEYENWLATYTVLNE